MDLKNDFRSTVFQEILNPKHNGSYPKTWEAVLTVIAKNDSHIKNIVFPKNTNPRDCILKNEVKGGGMSPINKDP